MQHKNLVNAYGTPKLTEDSRTVEAWGLTQAALNMKTAAEAGDVEAAKDAVRVNWRLWTIFQAEFLSVDNPLPVDLRGNLLSLAQFIDKRSVDFLSDPKLEKLEVMININRELAMGLFESVDNEKKAGGGESAEQKAARQAPPTGTVNIDT